jgi:hypothetical protein
MEEIINFLLIIAVYILIYYYIRKYKNIKKIKKNKEIKNKKIKNNYEINDNNKDIKVNDETKDIKVNDETKDNIINNKDIKVNDETKDNIINDKENIINNETKDIKVNDETKDNIINETKNIIINNETKDIIINETKDIIINNEIIDNDNNEILNKYCNIDKINYEEYIKPQKIDYDYNIEDLEIQFMNEQKNGVHFTTLCPNRWIQSFDPDGNPIYNSRENVTGVLESFIEPKARFSYEFNKENTLKMSGIIDPDDFIDGRGKTIKEIYDNSFVDFKKLTPKKTIIDNVSEEKSNSIQAASDLYYLPPDNWIYENEKQENGGKSIEGIYASDPSVTGLEAVFL